MPFGKPKSRKIQTDHLPGPIAVSYRRIFTRHEPDIERLMYVLDAAEITARFLGAVVLCTLRELEQAQRIESPLLPLGDPSVRMKKPSFGLWAEILREGARRVLESEDRFEDADARSLAVSVAEFVFNEKGKSKGRPYADLESILVIRNKVHHPGEELSIPTLCEDAETLLHQVLEGLAFFEDYTLYVVKQINLSRHRLGSPEFLHQCFLLQGEIDFPTAENDQRSWHSETNEVLVYRSASSYLNLDPLFVFVHADDIERVQAGRGGGAKGAEGELFPGLYCFGGFAKKASGVVVDYLPCVSSTKSFRTSNAPFRDASATERLNRGIAEFLELLDESPAREGAES